MRVYGKVSSRGDTYSAKARVGGDDSGLNLDVVLRRTLQLTAELQECFLFDKEYEFKRSVDLSISKLIIALILLLYLPK